MKSLRFWMILLLVLLSALDTPAQQAKPPLKTITQLDIQRYQGRWYEIAKFPNRFQRQCVSDTSADYSLLPNGKIRVLNQCRNSAGNWEHAIGVAQQIEGPQGAKLKVRFAPEWLSFLPFVWGDYWVIDLDEKYELVAVSEPQREFLWILSRSPVVSETRFDELTGRLAAMGLDIKLLEKTPQPLASENLK
jgi:apolipoprotein D and lipocalin family protein